MAVTGQLWFETQGVGSPRIVRVNSDGTTQTVVASGSAQLGTSFPQDIGLDTAAGFYFAIVNDGTLGTGAKLVRGSISGGAVTVLQSFVVGNDVNDSAGDDPIVSAFHVDPVAHRIYVGVQESTGANGAQSGIKYFDYNPATGALTGPASGTFLVTAASSGKAAESGFAIFDPFDFDIDHSTGTLYFSERQTGSALKSNGLFRLSLSNPNVVTQVVSQSQFPDNLSNGVIQDVEVDPVRNQVYFTASSQNPAGSSGGSYVATQNALWTVPGGSTNATATKVTLPGMSASFYPGDMVYDQQANQIYIESEESGGGNNADDRIYVFQLSGTGASTTATLIQTIAPDPAFSGDGSFGGMAFNALPTLAATTNAGGYIESAAAVFVFSGQPMIADSDGSHLNGATVQITGNLNGAIDRLNFTNQGGISGSYDTGSGTLTLTGYATVATYRTALASITYNATGDNPTNSGAAPNRTITTTVSDGSPGIPAGSVNSITTTLAVTGINDAPTFNNLSGDSAAAVSGGAAVLLDIGGNAAVADLDSANFDTGTLTVAVTNATAGDGLTVTTAGGITTAGAAVSFNGTQFATYTGAGGATLTFTFDPDATPSVVQALVRAVAFQTSSQTAGSRTVSFTLNDGDGVANGGANTATAATSVAVTVPNVAPTGTDNTLTVVEDGRLVLAFADFGAADSDGTVAGIRITTLPTAGDLYIDNDGAGGSVGTPVSINQTIAKSVFDAGRVVFVPAANGNGAGYATFTFQAQDNEGAYDASPNKIAVNVTPVNDAPTFFNLAGNVAAFSEGGAAVRIDVGADAVVADIDSADFDGGSLTVTITANAGATDVLGIAAGFVTLVGNEIRVGGTPIGTYAGGSDGAALVIAFGAGATPTRVRQLIYSLTFSTDGDTPSTATRSIGLTLVDGDGGAGTASVASSVTVTAVNDAPTAQNNTVTIAEDSRYVFSFADFGGADVDGTITGISINSVPSNGSLYYDTDGAGGSLGTPVNISAFSKTAIDNGYLTFVPAANFSSAPNPTFTFRVQDNSGTYSAGTNSFGFAVTPINDAPTATINTGGGFAPYGGEILVNTATAGRQDRPQITALSNGNFVVTWRDDSQGVGGAVGDASGTAVKAQVFAASGAPIGGEIRVNTATASWQDDQQITALSNGGFVVTWDDNSQGVGGAGGDTSSYAVKGQIFGAGGGRIGGEILVNTATVSAQYGRDTTGLSNGGFVVTWQDYSGGVGGAGGDASDYAIKAQVFGAGGGRVGDEILVNTATASIQEYSKITALSNGGFVVTWNDYSRGVGGAGGDASDYAVKAQVFGAGGAPVGGEILVNTATAGDQRPSAITALSNGDFVVTWSDFSRGVGGAGGDTSGYAVKAQVFSQGGAPIGGEILVNTATDGFQYGAQITALSNGGFVVTWTDSSQGVGGAGGDASGYAIKAQVFAAGAAPVGGEILVNTASVGIQEISQVTALSNGGFVVTWTDSSLGVGGAGGDPSGTAIKAQAFAADGAPVGGEVRVNTAVANAQDFQQTTALPNGGFVVTWQDASQGVGGTGGDASGTAIKAQVFGPVPVLTATEQVALDLKGALAVADVDAGAGVVTATLSVGAGVLAVAAGTSGVTVADSGIGSVTLTGTVAQINDLLSSNATSSVGYTANSDTPPASTTLTLVVDDGGNTGSGGAKTASASATITILPVNDAPSGTDATLTVAEDETVVLTAATFGFTDPADDDALLAVVFTTLPFPGTLLFDADGDGAGAPVAVSAGQSITAAALAAGRLFYAPAADGNGIGYANFTFQVRDDGGTADGGQDLDASPNTITLDVTAINDAPINVVPGPQTVDEDNDLVLSTVNGNAVSVSDVDATTLSVRLSVGAGVLTLASTSGLTFGEGDGNGDAVMTLSGTAVAINAAFGAGITYTPGPDENGGDTLSVVTSDGGEDGNGGAQSDTDSVAITVSAVNDAPVLTDPTATEVAYTENATPVRLLEGVTLSDPDAPGNFLGGGFTLMIDGATGDNGINFRTGSPFSANANGGGPAFLVIEETGTQISIGEITGLGTTSVTVANLTAQATPARVGALLSEFSYYTSSDDPATTDRTVTLTFDDGGNTGTGGALGDSVTQVLKTVAVDDAAVLDLNGATAGTGAAVAFAENDPATVLAPDAVVSDVDQQAFDGATLTASFTTGDAVDDRLRLVTVGDVESDETQVSYQGVVVGDVTGGTDPEKPLAITFNAAATLAAVQAVARAIGFANGSDAPGAGAREIAIALVDGAGNAAPVVTATVTVSVVEDTAQAFDDTVNTPETSVLNGNVLSDNGGGDDFDADGPAPLVTAVNGEAADVGQAIALASGALLTLRADGTFDYDPNGRFNTLTAQGSGAVNTAATDSFDYTITGGATATVTVVIEGVVTPDDVLMGDGDANDITGTEGDDLFDLSQGNDDQGDGLDGNDRFYLGAAMTGADALDGGAGTGDRLLLQGDYTGPNALTFGATSLVGIEIVELLSGSDTRFGDTAGNSYAYVLATVDANLTTGQTLVVDGSGLLSTEGLSFSGAAETSGRFEITGGGCNDLLGGGGSDDLLAGGDGFDLASYAGAPGAVRVDLQLQGTAQATGQGRDTLTGFEGLVGSSFNDALLGDSGVNRIEGGDGNDDISGRGGADLMIGGTGNDKYFVDDAGDQVVELGGEGNDRILTSVNYVLATGVEVETLVVNVATGLAITGNDLANRVFGQSGADRLDGGGGGGGDLLTGKAGDDTYVVRAGDRVVELADEGTDSVETDLAVYKLGANVENLTYTGTDRIEADGNTLGNTLVGGEGADKLDGNSGDDRLLGDGGNDRLLGDTGNDVLKGAGGRDTVDGGSGDDRVEGGSGNDRLFGKTGDDYLYGGSGSDRLTGDEGADTMRGGTGADRFIFTDAGDFASGAVLDRIIDFRNLEGDIVDLRKVDANELLPDDQAFTFIGTDAFALLTPGQLRFEIAPDGAFLVQGDTDGNGTADFSFLVTSDQPLIAADFAL